MKKIKNAYLNVGINETRHHMRKILVGAIVALVIGSGLAASYKVGANAGYSHGWSDAQCGKNADCEAGQE